MLTHTLLLDKFREARKSSVVLLEKFLSGDDFALFIIYDLHDFIDHVEFVEKIKNLLAKEASSGSLSNRENLLLGYVYFHGTGVKKNYLEAHNYFTKLQNCEALALVYIGKAYENNILFPQDKNIALAFFTQAMEMQPVLAFYLGWYHETYNDFNKALDYFFQAANLGCLPAYYYLAIGTFAKLPEFLAKIDSQIAMEFAICGASNGHVMSLTLVGRENWNSKNKLSKEIGFLYLEECRRCTHKPNPGSELEFAYILLKLGKLYEAALILHKNYGFYSSSLVGTNHSIKKNNLQSINTTVNTLLKKVEEDSTLNNKGKEYFEILYVCALILKDKSRFEKLVETNINLFAEISLNDYWDDLKLCLNEKTGQQVLAIRQQLLFQLKKCLRNFTYISGEENKKEFPIDIVNLIASYINLDKKSSLTLDLAIVKRLGCIHKELQQFSAEREEKEGVISLSLCQVISALPEVIREIANGNVALPITEIDSYLIDNTSDTTINKLIKESQLLLTNLKMVKTNAVNQRNIEENFSDFLSELQSVEKSFQAKILDALCQSYLTAADKKLLAQVNFTFQFQKMHQVIIENKGDNKVSLNYFIIKSLANLAKEKLPPAKTAPSAGFFKPNANNNAVPTSELSTNKNSKATRNPT